MTEPLMIFTDFDGTISIHDVCASMVKKFARPGWEEINRQWEQGTLSTEECAKRTLELITASPGEVREFFQNMEIDPDFPAFMVWTQKNEYPLYILSDGYDNYIRLILERYGIDLPYYANHLEYEQGWQMKSCYPDMECSRCGVCKTGLVKKLLTPGYKSVYIGDGYSDLCPAEYCEVVFAKKDLARLCRERGIPFYAYNTFADIQKILSGG